MLFLKYPHQEWLLTPKSTRGPSASRDDGGMPDRLEVLNRLLQAHVTARRVMAVLKAEVDRVARGLIAFTRRHLRREECLFSIYAGEYPTPVAWRDIGVTAHTLEQTLAAKALPGEKPPEEIAPTRRSRRHLAQIRR